MLGFFNYVSTLVSEYWFCANCFRQKQLIIVLAVHILLSCQTNIYFTKLHLLKYQYKYYSVL